MFSTSDQGVQPAVQPPADETPEENTPSRENQVREPWRFRFIITVFLLLGALLLARLFDYQVLSAGQSVWGHVPPEEHVPRGTVVDRNGELLAFDRFFTELSIDPSELEPGELDVVADELSALIDVERGQIAGAIRDAAGYRFALLAKDLEQHDGQRVLDAQAAQEADNVYSPLQKVHVRFIPERYYPQGELASHVLGLVGVDRHDESKRRGYYGTEGYYNSFLWQNGVDLQGRHFISTGDLDSAQRRYLPSVSGKDLVLTIDRTVQWIAEDELQTAVQQYKAQAGSVIVMEPRTGAILAMANWPTYDPNSYGEADPAAFSNTAVAAQYEPGSIFKIITMGAALDAGLIEPSTPFTDTGRITYGDRVFFNSNRSAVGLTNAADALARSLNVVTVQVAALLGPDRFYQYVRKFGFGEPTEIDLSGEVSGAVKLPYMRNWSPADLGANSFGQGLAVTPTQMIAAAAAIANDGRLMRPYVVQARIQDDKALVTAPTFLRQSISPESAEKLTEMMVGVIERGAPAARVEGYTLAGKTGTAQIPVEGGYSEDETIASFVGFGPAEDPAFVILIKLDRPDPKISQWASYSAAPTFARVAKRLLDYYHIPPDEIRLGGLASASE
ncbi:MAG: penicillin-binding protein 2 [Caldilineaceae bacterium]|nr:penicillin-binding protein 2 [Caldilineaceae bacterium]